MNTLADFKAQFSRTQRVHLNNAGLAPISRAARDKIIYWSQKFYDEGFYCDAEYMADVQRSRESLGRLLRCAPTEIAFFQSTAGALSQLAFGFDLKAGDEVLLWDQEYSSNLYPWREACKRRGAQLVLRESRTDYATPVDELLASRTSRTKIVAISWVQFQTGARTDIKSLVAECHRHGIFVVVDVMQGLGMHEFDFSGWNVDAAAGGSHKWLCAPVGAGFLALKQEHLSRFALHNVGSATYGTCDDPSSLECVPKTDVSRFEAGSKQVLEITALGAACDLILDTGVVTIEKEILRLSSALRQGLAGLGFDLHAPSAGAETSIVNFSSRQISLDRIKTALSAHPVNFAQRGPGLRLSPHAFNSDDDVQTVLDILRKLR